MCRILLFGLLGLMAAGCAPKEIEFRYAINAPLLSLEPSDVKDYASYTILKPAYEGLVGLNKDHKTVYMLASDVTTNGAQTSFAFQLRPGVVFADGKAVTASAVRHCLRRSERRLGKLPDLKKHETGLFGESAILTSGDSTIIFELPKPSRSFMSKLTQPSAWVYKEGATFDTGSEASEPGDIVGTGPYALDQIDPDQGVTLALSPTHKRQAGDFSKLHYVYVDDAQTRLVMFKNGETEVAPIECSQIDDVEDMNIEKNVLSRNTGTVAYLGMNTRPSSTHVSTLFEDAEVRKAIVCALDRKSLMGDMVRYAPPADWIVPRPVLDDAAASETLPKDQEAEAKQRWREVKKRLSPNGKWNPEVDLYFETSRSDLRYIANPVSERLGGVLNLTVHLKALEPAEFVRQYLAGNLGFVCLGWIGDDWDPASYLQELLVKGGDFNKLGFDRSEFDRDCKEADLQTDIKLSNRHYRDAQELANDEDILVPLCYPKMLLLAKKAVSKFVETRYFGYTAWGSDQMAAVGKVRIVSDPVLRSGTR